LTGSRLCGAVQYEASGTPVAFDLCHCSRCRKSGSSAFIAELVFDASDFRWAMGESLVRTYEAPVREKPPGYRRPFCKMCGGPVPTVAGNIIKIMGGTLEDDPGLQPQRHSSSISRLRGSTSWTPFRAFRASNSSKTRRF